MSPRKSVFSGVLVIAIALVFFGLAYSFADPPTAEITVAAGIPNVGVQETVSLTGNEGDTDITGYAWTLDTTPGGSTAALDDPASQTPSFVADVAGQYKVTLVVTNANGSSTPAELWINAGTYVGVGTVGGATPNTAEGQCGLCHSGNTTGWQGTHHSTKVEREIDGEGSSHYAGYCLGCHTVGYNADADNDGFDDFMGTAKSDTLNATYVADENTPVIDGDTDDVWRLAPALTVATGESDDYANCTSGCHDAGQDLIEGDVSVTLKALYSSDSLFIRASWSDPTASFTRGGSWSFDDTDSSWVKSSGQSEDRIAFYWPISGITGTLDDEGCMGKCHTVDGDGNPSAYGGEDLAYLTSGAADMWHSKAARSGAVTAASGSNLVIDS